MKKILAIGLALVIGLVFSGCGNTTPERPKDRDLPKPKSAITTAVDR